MLRGPRGPRGGRPAAGALAGARAKARPAAAHALGGGSGGGESRCPMARLVGLGGQRLSHNTYEYAPFTSTDYQGTYRMGMGLAPMKAEEWIEIDEDYEQEMALRRQLLAERREVVLQSTPEAEDANRELLELLAAHLPRAYPDRFHHMADGRLLNLATGDAFDLSDPGLDPLEASALLVQEDLCLMLQNAAGELRFVSGAVLFPQRWSLVEKIGMDLARIHAPVPLFAQHIGRPSEVFMARLQPGRPFWRCNWTITDNPHLFQPLVEQDIAAVNAGSVINGQWAAAPVSAADAGARLRTRMERETFTRLPRSRAVLFTIRTHMKPLAAFERKPEQARLLARALRNLHPAVTQYKTIAAFRPQALEYLDRVAAAAEPTPAAA